MKVLIAADGSEFSLAAIAECCRLFEKSMETEIEVISVYELFAAATEPFVMAPEYIQQMDDEAKAQAERAAEKALNSIREKSPALAAKAKCKIACGAPGQQIVEEAARWGADLIVCGSHGYGFWKRALMGSVSSAVVHHAPCSVMIVRAKQAAQIASA